MVDVVVGDHVVLAAAEVGQRDDDAATAGGVVARVVCLVGDLEVADLPVLAVVDADRLGDALAVDDGRVGGRVTVGIDGDALATLAGEAPIGQCTFADAAALEQHLVARLQRQRGGSGQCVEGGIDGCACAGRSGLAVDEVARALGSHGEVHHLGSGGRACTDHTSVDVDCDRGGIDIVGHTIIQRMWLDDVDGLHVFGRIGQGESGGQGNHPCHQCRTHHGRKHSAEFRQLRPPSGGGSSNARNVTANRRNTLGFSPV